MCLLYYSYFSGAYCTIPTVVLMPAYEVMTSPNLCANCAYYTIPTLVVPIILFLLSFKESSFKESRFILLLLLQKIKLQRIKIHPASAAYTVFCCLLLHILLFCNLVTKEQQQDQSPVDRLLEAGKNYPTAVALTYRS